MQLTLTNDDGIVIDQWNMIHDDVCVFESLLKERDFGVATYTRTIVQSAIDSLLDAD